MRIQRSRMFESISQSRAFPLKINKCIKEKRAAQIKYAVDNSNNTLKTFIQIAQFVKLVLQRIRTTIFPDNTLDKLNQF